MNRRIAVFLSVVLLAAAAAVRAQAPGARFSCLVTHVADGDTLDVLVGARTATVRLDGIDAPEGGQAFGGEARRRLRALTFGQHVTLVVKDTDRYGRLVARVLVGGRDASEEMVRAGLAWHFTRYSSDASLAALEADARGRRIGLWADRSPVAPWTWRDVRAGRPPQPRAPAPPANRAAVPGPYHGNASSRVYHAPGCRDYNCRHCTLVFATREQAEAAGYGAHRDCVFR